MNSSHLNPTFSLSRMIGFMIFLCCISFQIGATGVYKWIDENGNTHYSDIKPNNTQSKTIKIRTNSLSSPRQPPEEQAKTLAESKERELELKAKKLQTEKQQQELDSKCEAIRSNLKTVIENSRIKIEDNGEPASKLKTMVSFAT